MSYISFVWLTTLSLLINPLLPANNLQYPPSEVEGQIIGTWYLQDQQMLINGKDIDEHFEEIAAVLSASSNYGVNPRLLAKKFKEGFRGIPEGTAFLFKDNYSYQIVIPDKQPQEGMWRVRNGHILLQAKEQQMTLLVKQLNDESATFVIKNEKVDSNMTLGERSVMELVLDLSR